MPDARSSATPTQSKEWLWVSSRGTSREASTKADDAHRDVDEEDPLPAGTVDEQTADQRADEGGDAGRRTPQRHGLRRARSGGKVRVMTAIVCGVIMAAPRPWTTRATMSR